VRYFSTPTTKRFLQRFVSKPMKVVWVYTNIARNFRRKPYLTLLLCKRSEVESDLGMTSFEVVATQLFDLQKIARKNILELVPYRCARDVS